MMRILGAALFALMAGNAAWAHDEASAGEHDGKPHSHWWLDMNADLNLTWYAGAGLGQSRYDNYALFDDGSFTSHRTDDTDVALRAFGGMGIGKYFGLEAAYADFGEGTSRAQSDGSGTFWNAGPQAVRIAAEGYGIALLGRVPVTDDWGVFAKVGVSWLDVEFAIAVDTQFGAANDRSKDTDEDVAYSGGIHYDGLRPVRIVAEYGVLPSEVGFFAPDGDLDWLAISAAYLF